MKFYSQTTSERKRSKELAMSILRYVQTLLHFRENLICKLSCQYTVVVHPQIFTTMKISLPMVGVM